MTSYNRAGFPEEIAARCLSASPPTPPSPGNSSSRPTSSRTASPIRPARSRRSSPRSSRRTRVRGKRIAVGAGSRGIDRIPDIVRDRRRGAEGQGRRAVHRAGDGQPRRLHRRRPAGHPRRPGHHRGHGRRADPAAHGHAAGRPHRRRHAGLRLGGSARRRRRDPGQPHQAAHRLREHAPRQRHPEDGGDRPRPLRRRRRLPPRRRTPRLRGRAAGRRPGRSSAT